MRVVLPLLCTLLGLLPWATGSARAQEERLELAGDPGAFTDVPDAFDGDDPFDLRVDLAYRHEVVSGPVRREFNASEASDGRSTYNLWNIADYERKVDALDIALSFGLYKDLAFSVELPVVLRDERGLSLPSGRTEDQIADRLAVTRPDGSVESVLGDPEGDGPVPAKSPTRSGVGQVILGLSWSPFNQFRDRHLPTWTLVGKVSLPLNDVLAPCLEGADGVACASGDEPGVSDGVTYLSLESRTSYRYRFLEPFAGLGVRLGLPTTGDGNFEPTGELDGFVNVMPPVVGTLTAGLDLVPWERRERFQRVSFQLKGVGRYISEGHSYSPLFDALGTSAYLQTPVRECSATPADGEPDPCPPRVPFTGLTDTQAHTAFEGSLHAEVRAARYVRFSVGGTVSYTGPHVMTFADSCNPSPNVATDDPRRGRCREGIINPHHRAAIDSPGSRFVMGRQFGYSMQAQATASF